MVNGEKCSWCKAGDSECDWSFSDFTQSIFPTSISSLVGGRGFPYYHPSIQKPFDSGDNTAPNDAITMAIVVSHGNSRNGRDYCSYMTNAVLNSGGNLSSTLVIATQIYETGDAAIDESTMIWWSKSSSDNGQRNWKWGGNSTEELNASISSFSVFDEIVLKLAERTSYPNLRRVVFAGHSAGGQVMQRYALFSMMGPGGALSGSLPADLNISYYIANPSSTTYLSAERPVNVSPADRNCSFCDNSTLTQQQWTFAMPKEGDGSAAASCLSTYNSYGYGLEGTLMDYPGGVGIDAALSQYPLRDVTYMSGESDVCDTDYQSSHNCTTCTVDDGGLDVSCEGYAQGWCRMARLHAFSQHVNGYYEEPVHTLLSVPFVGHSGCGMFQSEEFAAAALS